MTNIYLAKTNRINERLVDVYRECLNEITATAKENGIVKINFSLHKELGIDIPYLVFEKEHFDDVKGEMLSDYSYEMLGEMIFSEEYDHITLIGEHISSAYMDEYWGDFFDIAKIGQIYRAFMEIVCNNDLKPIEIK